MLVVHVPEGRLLEDPLHVRQLEQHDGLAPLPDRRPNGPHELADRRDVLERVAAHHGVGVQVRVVLGVEVRDPVDAGRRFTLAPLGVGPGVDADAPTDAGLAHHLEELALAAADLQHRPVREGVLLDPTLREIAREVVETLREPLGLLVASGVLGQRRIEQRVEDEPAVVAEAKLEVAAWIALGLGTVARAAGSCWWAHRAHGGKAGRARTLTGGTGRPQRGRSQDLRCGNGHDEAAAALAVVAPAGA